MTAGGLPGEPAEQQAPATDIPPYAEPAPALAADAAAETAPEEAAEPAAPHDTRQLHEEIEQARGQLGQTVEQLAAKVDVKSRARDKAAGLTGRVKGSAARAREQAARTAGARGRLAGTAAAARQKAIAAGQTGKGQLERRAAPVRDAMPEPVRQGVAKGASAVRQRPLPLAVALALVLGFVAIRQWRRR